MKKLTVRDSIYMLADAWEEASAESIFKAFSKLQIHPDAETRLLNDSERQTESIVSEPMMKVVNEVGNSEGLSTSDVNDWLRADDELPT